MDVLVEVHDGDEFDRALKLKSRLIGINNRNLKTFDVDLDRTIELAARAPEDATLVSESGLSTRTDLDALAAHGINCFLIGEALMRQRSEEHTSELQSLMRISYAVFCLQKKQM